MVCIQHHSRSQCTQSMPCMSDACCCRSPFQRVFIWYCACPYCVRSPHARTVYSHHMPVQCTVTTSPYGVQSPHARTVYSHHMPVRCTVTACPYGVQSLQAPSDGAKFIASMSTNMGTKTSSCWVVSGLVVISRECSKHPPALLTAAVS